MNQLRVWLTGAVYLLLCLSGAALAKRLEMLSATTNLGQACVKYGVQGQCKRGTAAVLIMQTVKLVSHLSRCKACITCAIPERPGSLENSTWPRCGREDTR